MALKTNEDSVKRKAVLNTLDTMDKALDEDRTVEVYKELLAECFKVLPAVTPKPIECEDCVSRETVIELLKDLEREDIERYGCKIPEGFDAEEAVEAVRKLLRVTPKQRMGKWIKICPMVVDGGLTKRIKCSECGDERLDYFISKRYCPNCGAKMEGESE